MYICICHGVTDHQIRTAVQEQGLSSLRELASELRVGTTCGRCARCARDLVSSCCKQGATCEVQAEVA